MIKNTPNHQPSPATHSTTNHHHLVALKPFSSHRKTPRSTSHYELSTLAISNQSSTAHGLLHPNTSPELIKPLARLASQRVSAQRTIRYFTLSNHLAPVISCAHLDTTFYDSSHPPIFQHAFRHSPQIAIVPFATSVTTVATTRHKSTSYDHYSHQSSFITIDHDSLHVP